MIAFLMVNGYNLVMNDDTLFGRMIEACITEDMTEQQMAEDLDAFVFDLDRGIPSVQVKALILPDSY